MAGAGRSDEWISGIVCRGSKHHSQSDSHISSFVKGGVIILGTAFIDLVIAFTTPYWATWSSDLRAQHGGYGLWQTWQCPGTDLPPEEQHHTNEGCAIRWTDTTFPNWYIVCEVCISLGLAGLLSSLIMLLCYIFSPRCYKSIPVMDAIIGTSYTGGLCLLVGLVLFGWRVMDGIPTSGSDWFLSWSFSLACTAFVLNAISATVLVTESKRLHKHKNRLDKMDKSGLFSGYVRLPQPGEMGELSQEQQTWGQFCGVAKVHEFRESVYMCRHVEYG